MTQPGTLVIKPTSGWAALRLGDIWEYRELVYFLTWRDIRVRYKQTILGVAWAVLQPLMLMGIFSIFFGRLAKLPSEGLPYPVFVFCGLVPWQLFAYALTQSSNSLVANERLITKVYFPRLVMPLSATLSGLVDLLIALVLLLMMMGYYGITWTAALWTLPIFVMLAVVSALAVGLWLSALNVEYRDVRYALPFLSQFWLLASPVGYSSALIGDGWRWLYALNPMVGVIEGFRWALLGNAEGLEAKFSVSVAVVVMLLVGGLYYFRRMEKTFADVV